MKLNGTSRLGLPNSRNRCRIISLRTHTASNEIDRFTSIIISSTARISSPFDPFDRKSVVASAFPVPDESLNYPATNPDRPPRNQESDRAAKGNVGNDFN